MEGGPMEEQSRDHLFGQVYSRKQKDVMEVVDVTNLNPLSSSDDPSPMNEVELLCYTNQDTVGSCYARLFEGEADRVQTRTRGVKEPDARALLPRLSPLLSEKKKKVVVQAAATASEVVPAAGGDDGGWDGGARVLTDRGQQAEQTVSLTSYWEMEYHRRGKGRAGPSSEADREPSPTHSDAHTPRGDSVSDPQYAQLGGGAQTPPRQTPPVDQQTILLTTLQTLTSLVQTMVSNQRSNASPSGDTSTPVREKATAVSYQQFMAMQPPIFSRGGSYDKAKQWIEEIERIFVLLEMPEENKVNYGTYLLKGNALDWWKSTLEIRFAGQPSLSWMQFRDSFLDTYYPVHARDQKMQEFLDLQQNQLNLEDYITRYRHLEAYCPHFYTTDGARAGKFVRGLQEGLRSKVLSSRPRDLDEAVTMARCIEEDWVRTQKDHQKRTGQHSQGGRTQ
ncbi:hypothetical protein EJ110_NYTH59617, partial [Nymphaea thermarum]